MAPQRAHTWLLPAGNEAIAAVGLKARPRYHVASDGNLHWARAPYANKDLGAGMQQVWPHPLP